MRVLLALFFSLSLSAQIVAVKHRQVLLQAVATPTDSPGAGSYGSTQSVTLSTATSGATICYTTNGTTPAATTPGTCSTGSTYSTAISVSATTTIKALGTKSGMANSGVLTSTYTITGPVIAQVATTQSAGATGGGTATTSGIDTTGATLLIVAIGGGNNCDTSTVSDSKANTWQALRSVSTAGSIPGGSDLCMWYSYNKAGGALVVGAGHTVSVNNNYPQIAFAAFSHTLTGATNPLDSTAGQASSGSANTSSTTVQPGSITPSVANSLVVSAFKGPTAGAVSVSSPFAASGANGTFDAVYIGISVQTTATAVNPTWTTTSAAGLGATIASFMHE